MEIVSVKFQEEVLKEVDNKIAKHNFNSRTEFIREAVRDKLKGLTQEERIDAFMKFYGKSKKKTTEEENERTREIVSKEMLAELKKRFAQHPAAAQSSPRQQGIRAGADR
jgi:metal-responsive CopG/Arc/MetJ family transcriptional regulator